MTNNCQTACIKKKKFLIFIIYTNISVAKHEYCNECIYNNVFLFIVINLLIGTIFNMIKIELNTYRMFISKYKFMYAYELYMYNRIFFLK